MGLRMDAEAACTGVESSVEGAAGGELSAVE